jgi:hypothetical protein
MFRFLLMVIHTTLLLTGAVAAEEISTAELTKQAAQGDAAAQLALACRYRDGQGVARNYPEALRFGHLAADQGHPAALDFVGWMYFRGVGVAHQPKLAFGYFRAAANEHPTAAWNLGQCYFAAQGVEQDIPKTLQLWEKAAEMGHGRSASTAAMVYLAGDGVTANPQQARKLAERAAALGDPNGLVLLGELQFQAREIEAARATWAKIAQTKPTQPTGSPEQPSAEMAAQQAADLIRLIEHRQRQPEPGKFALVNVPHVHQGWNNCGATSCAMYARALSGKAGSWEIKQHCPSPLGTGTDWAHLVQAAEKIGQRWKLITFPADDAGFAKATQFARDEMDAGRPLVIDFKYIGDRYAGGEAGHTLLLAGYIASEDLYVLCNPAIATPGFHLMTGEDLKRYWRSDGYSSTSGGVLSRPAIVIAK